MDWDQAVAVMVHQNSVHRSRCIAGCGDLAGYGDRAFFDPMRRASRVPMP